MREETADNIIILIFIGLSLGVGIILGTQSEVKNHMKCLELEIGKDKCNQIFEEKK